MFENAVMLAGLGGAAVPAVIHLLGRARYRTVDWGAMMFLESNAPRWRDGVKLREWALLAVRMAAVGLLAIALARPVAGVVAGTGAAGAGEPPRISAVIIVDCSASMAYEDVGGSRIERAKGAALQVLSTLRRGDRACVIAAGAAQDRMAAPQLSNDLQSVAARVSELKPTPGAADFAAALSTAAALYDRQQNRAARQLFVICDRQAASWRNVDDSFLSNWASSSSTRAGLSSFAVIPVGGAETDNVSIESVALLNPPAVRGCAAQVKVKVRNHGRTPRLGLPLTLRFATGARDLITTATMNLAGGEGDSVIVPVTFASPGPAVLSAELRGGGPNLDDRRDCVVDVSPPLRVLIVGENGDSSLLRAALAPYSAAGHDGPDLADVRNVAANDWDENNLGSFDVVVLDDVASPTAAQTAALEQFVYAGGGLLIAPGPAARAERYNQAMYHEEGGLLPALLQPPIAAAAAIAGIDPASIDASHPMLRFMSGRTQPLDVRVHHYLPVTARTPAAHVTAAYSSGDAFLIDSPYGRGRVLLMTCGLGDRWSSLPLTSFYLPLVQSAARYLAGADAPERNTTSGSELVATFVPAVPAGARAATVTRPDGTRDTCGISTIDQRSEARYARTDLPGLYTIQAGPRGDERRAVFSVAPPAVESDLTPLSEDDWRRFERSLGFTRLETGERPLAARVSAARGGGNEYWLAALAGVMGLLVIELAMTRAWSGANDKETT
jgi:hypothetical protein